jgi:hypothetical protein
MPKACFDLRGCSHDWEPNLTVAALVESNRYLRVILKWLSQYQRRTLQESFKSTAVQLDFLV